MKWTTQKSSPEQMDFAIEQQLFTDNTDHKEYGFYIYVYKNHVGIADYLQDTLQDAKEFIFKRYDIPIDSWQLAE